MGADLRDLLRQHGFTPFNAERWSNFVQHVLKLFQDAADTLRQQENWESFKQKKGALGVAQKRKRQKIIQRVPIEDAITSELSHFVQRARRAVSKTHFLRLNEVEFLAEFLVPSTTLAGRHSRKVDFYVCSSVGEGAPELAIEAKPIVTKGDISGRYLAKEGIGCFLTEDPPYTRGPLGAMLAYTISNTGHSWRTEVRAAVSVYQPKALQLEDVRIEGAQEPLIFSRHERGALGLGPIAVLHLEMIFTPDIQGTVEL